MKKIVLNKMYSGEYLLNNLGHEVINLFKTDNGENYVYLNPDGKLPSTHSKKIECVLFVKNYTPNCLQIIGKAVELEEIRESNQVEFITNNKITYGGTLLHNIFYGNQFQYDYLTFKAGSVMTPIAPIIITFEKEIANANPNYVLLDKLEKDMMRSSLRQYFDDETETNSYNALKGIINNTNLWGIETQKIDPQRFMEDTFFTRIQNNRPLNELFIKKQK